MVAGKVGERGQGCLSEVEGLEESNEEGGWGAARRVRSGGDGM